MEGLRKTTKLSAGIIGVSASLELKSEVLPTEPACSRFSCWKAVYFQHNASRFVDLCSGDGCDCRLLYTQTRKLRTQTRLANFLESACCKILVDR
jgi:hypothetical protein